MVFFFLCRVEWSGHDAVRSTCTQCPIESGTGNLGNHLHFFASSNARRRAHIEHFHTCSVLQPSSRCDSWCEFRRFPTLFVCVLFVQTQNDLLRSTIFHISSLWCRALALYGDVSKLMQEALAALNTTIPVLYQHGDFGAFLVEIDWSKHCQDPFLPSTSSLLSRSPRKSPPWRGGTPRERVPLSLSIHLVGECLEEEADRPWYAGNVGHVSNLPPQTHVCVAEHLCPAE